MTSPGCAADQPLSQPLSPAPSLTVRPGGDGSFSLWSESFGEGFHSGRGALREARETFLRPSGLRPSGLEGRQPGRRLRVLEVCAGTCTNLALLHEACASAAISLEWCGLELDPHPLALALAADSFRSPWRPQTLANLESLQRCGHWRQPGSSGRMLWGDGRRGVAELAESWSGTVDLIWHDAFSPQRCPQLWSQDFLARLAALLAPRGRWISYCSAAAVRETLRGLGMGLGALAIPDPAPNPPLAVLDNAGSGVESRLVWSGGTVASPTALGPDPLWRELTAMERDHLACAAGEPYRDPDGMATAATILAQRLEAQARGCRCPSSAWRRRWGVERRGAGGVG